MVRNGRRARRVAARAESPAAVVAGRAIAVPAACRTRLSSRLQDGADGMAATIEPLTAESFADDSECYGPFRARDDALKALNGKAREAGLCLRAAGARERRGLVRRAPARSLPRCLRRHASRVHCTMHARRLALASLRLKRWPFAGAIAVREPAPDGHGSVLHVLDRWRHVGTAARRGRAPGPVAHATARRTCRSTSTAIGSSAAVSNAPGRVTS